MGEDIECNDATEALNEPIGDRRMERLTVHFSQNREGTLSVDT